MARTFTSVVTEALAQDFDATTYQTLAGQYLNDCLKLLARDTRVPLQDATATLTTTINVATTPLPATFIRVFDIFDPLTNEALEEVTQEWIDEQDVATGIPTVYALYGSNVVWYPTPSSVRNFTIHYVTFPADLSGANPISGVIPDEYGDLLTSYIRWHLFRFEDDAELAAFWKLEHDNVKRDLISSFATRGARVRRTPSMFRREVSPTFRTP